ncbi:MAG: serine O-acetyltransferase EpsC [Paludibacter sp.]
MDNILTETIDKLSIPEGFREVCHECGTKDSMPSVDILKEFVLIARSILFPGYFGDPEVNEHTMRCHIENNINHLNSILRQQIKAGICFSFNGESHDMKKVEEEAIDKTNIFLTLLPEIRDKLHTDVVAAYNGDPAAKSFGEVIFCYPSIRAISNYRMAHALLKLDVPLIPRIITEMAHSETGIDIHPGATIGDYFTIDHGTGVVIGETATIGNNVKMYQGVTLGAKSFPLDEDGNPIKGIPRHPHIGNNVIIYSNSTILGTITVGDGAVIGGNLWVDSDVPAGAKLAQKK